MRFSTSAVLAAAAIGAQALPQEVQPISQISDGQIQAPPPTASAPVAPVTSAYAVPTVSATEVIIPSVSAVLPTSVVVPVPVPTGGYSTPVGSPVIPVPIGTGSPSLPPYPISSGATYTNGTVAPTGGASSAAPSSSAGESSASSPQPTAPGNSGATTNMVSFAAVFAGLLAYLA